MSSKYPIIIFLSFSFCFYPLISFYFVTLRISNVYIYGNYKVPLWLPELSDNHVHCFTDCPSHEVASTKTGYFYYLPNKGSHESVPFLSCNINVIYPYCGLAQTLNMFRSRQVNGIHARLLHIYGHEQRTPVFRILQATCLRYRHFDLKCSCFLRCACGCRKKS